MSPNGSDRPPMLRKMSGLDYDEALALPMPKPRHLKTDSDDSSNPFQDGNERPNLLKKRFATDTVTSLVHATPEPASPKDKHEGKKKSRLEMIKSKLSFKDLRKEIVKEDLAACPATPPYRAFTGSAIPTLAPSSQASNVKTKMYSAKSDPPPKILQASNLRVPNHFTEKLPLPSSGSFSNLSGSTPTITRERSCRSSAASSAMGMQPPSSTSSLITKDETSPILSDPTPVVTERLRSGISIPRSTGATTARMPSSPNNLPAPKYPVTKDSPPDINDLIEGECKVKYLPKTWVGESYRRISDGHNQGINQTPSPTVYAKGGPPVASLSNYLPSFKERLDKIDLSPQETSSGEGKSHSTANQIDDILGMIKAIQRRVDGGVANMNKKLDELCAWTNDQLSNQITSNGDLSQANSDLFSKQCQLSREMMKFQLDIRLEIGTMERRLSTFESKIIELQNEVRSLAKSHEELDSKTAIMIAKHSFNDNRSFIELQVHKNMEIEREMAYPKSRQGNSISRDDASFTPTNVTPQQSFSCNGSSEPLIKLLPTSPNACTTPRNWPTSNDVPITPERIQSTPKEVHATPKDVSVTPIRPRMISLMENKTGSLLPRSVSLTGKGIIKGIKDITSSTSDTKENKERAHSDKTKSQDESKKWSLFSMRTRRHEESTSSISSNRHHWPRRSKDIPNHGEEATVSSRSSTPPLPPIPCSPRTYANVWPIQRIPTPFPSSMVDSIYSVHPAFRGQDRGPTGASASSYEAEPQSFRNVDLDIMEKKILDGSVSAFAEAPNLEVDDDESNVPLLGALTPSLKVCEDIIEVSR